MAVEYVNFTIGDNYGQLITDIAQEKLLYNYDLEGALEFLYKTGIKDRELCFDILFGKIQLGVEDNKYLIPVYESKLPPILELHEIRLRDIRDSLSGLRRSLDNLPFDYSLNLEWNVLLQTLGDNEFDIEEHIKDTETVQNLELLIKVVRDFLDTTFKFYTYSKQVQAVINSKYQDLYCRKVNGKYIPVEFEILQGPEMLNTKLGLLLSGIQEHEYKSFARDLDKYTKALIAINRGEILEPSDKIHDAGWVSPDGLYYGLDGETANMLHNQIADFLQKQGLVPKEYENNPEVYLGEQGWMKQHGRWLLTDAYFHNKEVTDSQLKTLGKLTRDIYPSFLVGFQRVEFTITNLLMMDQIMRKKHFHI